MSFLSGVLRQLWRLFVDDGSLAGTLVIWCVGAGSVLPRWITFGGWNAPILFVGCIAILLTNIMLAARHHRSRRRTNSNAE